MSNNDDGGSAFPSKFEIDGPNFDPIKGKNIKVGHTETYIQMGMDLRDYFAVHVQVDASTVVGILIARGQDEASADELAEIEAALRYNKADAMLAERAK